MEDENIFAFFTLFTFGIVVGGGFLVFSFKLSSLYIQFMAFKLMGKNPFRYIDPVPKSLEPYQERILISHFAYYRNMPPRMQGIFRNRLAKFMQAKSFETRQGIEMTEEIKVLVSACAIQLTFGLADYKLSHFDRILIYPEAYYSRITKRFHKGEVNARGLVVLSWQDFKEGYSEPHDNLNLGLHEFAHALFISYQKNQHDCINFDYYYQQWRDIGDREFFKMRGRKENYLRSYGAVNLMEFFSVSVEHFFEAPNAFKENLPELYDVLSKFLGQDPCKWVKA